MKRTAILAATVILAAVLATSPAAARTTKPSASCRSALKAADRLADSYANYVVTAIEATGTDDEAIAAGFALVRIGSEGTDLAARYAKLAAKCRAGR